MKTSLIAAFASLMLFVADAAAAPVLKFEFTGTVDVAGAPWSTNGINVGDPVNGFFSYDLNSTDSEASPDFGRYAQSAPLRAEVSVGGFTFGSSNFSVDIFDDDLFIFDGITVTFLEDVSDGGITVLGFNNSPFFSLSSPSDIFDGDALFTDIDLGLFPDRFGGLLADGPGASQLQYTITSVTRIPLPATAVLLCLGLAVLGFRTRRDKTAA
ncbi:MAG: hypothetical protein QNJ91_09240 [Gammaproteobacteria bacterium]|nr:hypothetical protein [Gammaproteobacteria bacterium]